MMTRICSLCKIDQPISNFNFKNIKAQTYETWCKSCKNQYYQNKWKVKKSEMVEYFGGSCNQCGYNKNVAALHIHHLDPKIKEYNWVDLYSKPSDILKAELEKCILLCANCHAETHHPECDSTILPKTYKIKKEKILNHCKVCNQEVNFGTTFCSNKCKGKGQRKTQWPSKEELFEALTKFTIPELNKKYLVSEHSIRYWCKCYNLPYKFHELKKLRAKYR
jgi:hypothetical protein